MNIKSLTTVTTSITLGAIAIPFFALSTLAEVRVEETDKELPEDRVTFYCGKISEPGIGDNVPTTLAYVPQRKAHIPIVAWTNDSLAAWNPERRCKAVSARFQTFNKDGRLHYLSNGESAGYQVVCALLDKQEQCSEENQLFNIREGTDPKDVIVRLKDVLGGKTNNTEIIQQGSGEKDYISYISISELLENAPAIEDELAIVK